MTENRFRDGVLSAQTLPIVSSTHKQGRTSAVQKCDCVTRLGRTHAEANIQLVVCYEALVCFIHKIRWNRVPQTRRPSPADCSLAGDEVKEFQQ